MAEETEGQDTGAQAAAGAVNPAAVALALGGASREEADNFLRNQNALIADQRHHLHVQLTQAHLSIWKECLGVLLRVATAVVGIVVAAGFAFMVRDASQSNGLLIEPFSVPPDLAKNGMNGEVVAAKLLDRLSVMQAQTTSNRAARTYANSWDEKGIRLDIPETGVSLAELNNFLREKLGRDTHVSGEIVRTASGVSLTVRAGSNGADSFSGSDTELETLIRRSSESIYQMTQPYRFAYYLSTHDRASEAVPIFIALAKTGPVQERPWGYLGWGVSLADSVGIEAYVSAMKRSLALQPDNIVVLINLAQTEEEQSLPEQAVRDARQTKVLLSSDSRAMLRADLIPTLTKAAQAQIDRESGAFDDATRELTDLVESGVSGRYGQPALLARVEISAHSLASARATLTYPETPLGQIQGSIALYKIWAELQLASETQNWANVMFGTNAADPLLAKYPGVRSLLPTTVEPIFAYAEAKLGNMAAAEARIAATPASCYRCLITRARIAELKGEHARADWWFARAVAAAPSIPFAEAEWGEALLARGQPDAAIEKFKLANAKGPHFADPLEGWGEALMAKNQSHLALAKFEEAHKYAPNWGRLHLKWGEALVYTGKKDEAKAHFARAAALDLTPSEKSELARSHAVATNP